MTKPKNILAIIPARGGSKRLPKKNVRLLAGKPLIVHTIDAAKNSKHALRVVVSTDDSEIMDVSKKAGAEVIERPKEIAGDDAKVIDAVSHVVSELKKEEYIPDVIILLQPTSPLRTTKDIDEALDLFLNNPCEAVIGVSEIDSSFHWAMTTKEKYLAPYFGFSHFSLRSQDLPNVYKPNGTIFIYAIDTLLAQQKFYWENMKALPYIMSKETSIDIDYEIDFKLTEWLLK